jgi:hypothetical protein
MKLSNEHEFRNYNFGFETVKTQRLIAMRDRFAVVLSFFFFFGIAPVEPVLLSQLNQLLPLHLLLSQVHPMYIK